MTMLAPKSNPVRDPFWLNELAKRPCVITGNAALVRRPAHIYWRSNCGIGMDPSDDRAIPLSSGYAARMKGMNEVDFWREAFAENPAFKAECWRALRIKGDIPTDDADTLMMLSLLAWAQKEYQTWRRTAITIPDKALSIRQPWAWCCIRPDIEDDTERRHAYADKRIKDVENRDWQYSNHNLKFRGYFLIHAGLNLDANFDRLWASAILGRDAPADCELQRGGIVGMAELVTTVQHLDSPWYFGPRGLILRNARPLPFMPYKGQLGFFNVQYDRSLLA